MVRVQRGGLELVLALVDAQAAVLSCYDVQLADEGVVRDR